MLANESSGSLRTAFLQLAAIFFPISLLLMTLSGRDYVYYSIALIPASLLAIGMGGNLLLRSGSPANPRANAVIVLAFALALAYNPVLFLLGQYRAQRESPQPEIAAYVQQHTRQDESILVWGKDTTYVYFTAGRKAPSRYFYQAAIELESYNRAYGAAAELLRDMELNPPALFLIQSEPAPPGVCPLPVSAEENSAGRIFQFICERYEVADHVAGFQVYRYLK